MTSQSKSKAQRRAENQRNAAEKRAAEQRAKRMRIGIRAGGAVVLIALVVILIVVVTGGSNSGTPPTVKNPHIALEPIPASMSSSWVQPPAGTPGPETIPVPSGPKLATLLNAATGQNVDGIQCQTNEQTVTHVHTHLTIFVNGKARVIPYGVGIPGFQAVSTAQGPFVQTGSCFYWLHAHANDGIIHVSRRAPRTASPWASSSRNGASRSARRRSARPRGMSRSSSRHRARRRSSTRAIPTTSRWATTTRFSSSWGRP